MLELSANFRVRSELQQKTALPGNFTIDCGIAHPHPSRINAANTAPFL
jgi:hypothetical protein